MIRSRQDLHGSDRAMVDPYHHQQHHHHQQQQQQQQQQETTATTARRYYPQHHSHANQEEYLSDPEHSTVRGDERGYVASSSILLRVSDQYRDRCDNNECRAFVSTGGIEWDVSNLCVAGPSRSHHGSAAHSSGRQSVYTRQRPPVMDEPSLYPSPRDIPSITDDEISSMWEASHSSKWRRVSSNLNSDCGTRAPAIDASRQSSCPHSTFTTTETYRPVSRRSARTSISSALDRIGDLDEFGRSVSYDRVDDSHIDVTNRSSSRSSTNGFDGTNAHTYGSRSVDAHSVQANGRSSDAMSPPSALQANSSVFSAASSSKYRRRCGLAATSRTTTHIVSNNSNSMTSISTCDHSSVDRWGNSSSGVSDEPPSSPYNSGAYSPSLSHQLNKRRPQQPYRQSDCHHRQRYPYQSQHQFQHDDQPSQSSIRRLSTQSFQDPFRQGQQGGYRQYHEKAHHDDHRQYNDNHGPYSRDDPSSNRHRHHMDDSALRRDHRRSSKESGFDRRRSDSHFSDDVAYNHEMRGIEAKLKDPSKYGSFVEADDPREHAHYEDQFNDGCGPCDEGDYISYVDDDDGCYDERRSHGLNHSHRYHDDPASYHDEQSVATSRQQRKELRIEVSPGVSMFVRTSQETEDAVRNGCSQVVTCMGCNVSLRSVPDCQIVICPECRFMSPVDETSENVLVQRERYLMWRMKNYDDAVPRTDGGGIGLGMRA